jgi:hypothetical protein
MTITTNLADDMLIGAESIGEWIGKTPKETGYLLGTNQLPAFKLAEKWHMRKSRYLKYLEEQEDATLAKRRAG